MSRTCLLLTLVMRILTFKKLWNTCNKDHHHIYIAFHTCSARVLKSLSIPTNILDSPPPSVYPSVCSLQRLHGEAFHFGHSVFKGQFLVAGAMDTFARGLRNAVKIIEEGVLSKALSVSALYTYFRVAQFQIMTHVQACLL